MDLITVYMCNKKYQGQIINVQLMDITKQYAHLVVT